jgi:hypothetical protein
VLQGDGNGEEERPFFLPAGNKKRINKEKEKPIGLGRNLYLV